MNTKLPKSNHRKAIFPFHRLTEVGKFFTVKTAKQRNSVFSCLNYYNKKHGFDIKIKTKKVGGVIRVERIEKT